MSTTTTRTAHATMGFSDWQEDPAWGDDAPLPRLAQATVTFSYEGDLQATSTCRYTLSYGPDGQGNALGFETVEGTLEGRTGGFVLRHDAAFTATGVDYTFTVVPGSGTGELTGLLGEGNCTAEHGAEASAWALTYQVDED